MSVTKLNISNDIFVFSRVFNELLSNFMEQSPY
jgi:hypothetical protein